jgi:hypothetical protein
MDIYVLKSHMIGIGEQYEASFETSEDAQKSLPSLEWTQESNEEYWTTKESLAVTWSIERDAVLRSGTILQTVQERAESDHSEIGW